MRTSVVAMTLLFNSANSLLAQESAPVALETGSLNSIIASTEEQEKMRPLIDFAIKTQSYKRTDGEIGQNENCAGKLSSEFNNQWSETETAIINNQYSDLDNYLARVPEITRGMSAREKQCFVAKNIELFQRNYTTGATFAKLTAHDVYENFQQDLSTGVCVHLHHLGALVGESMGYKCGTISTNWYTDASNGGESFGNHVVTLCQDRQNGEYFMSNYGSVFNLDANLYTEAIDSLNNVIGPMNLQGSIISCFGDTPKLRDNCYHEYIPAETRWSLYALSKGLDRLEPGNKNAPISFELHNRGLTFTLNGQRQKDFSKLNRHGKITSYKNGSGPLAVYTSFGDTNFSAIGYGINRQQVNANQAEHRIKLFLGAYYFQTENLLIGLYANDSSLDIGGGLIYSQSTHVWPIGQSSKIGVSLDGAVMTDIKLTSSGLTNQMAIFALQEFGPHVQLQFEQVAVFNGENQRNSVALHPERSTLGVQTTASSKQNLISWINVIELHYLPSSGQRGALAFEIEGDLIFGKNDMNQANDLYLNAHYNIGLTSFSEDPYYTNVDGSRVVYYDLEGQMVYRPSKRTSIQIYGEVSPSDMPQWFGDEALIIDSQVLPQRRTPGLEAGVRVEVKLGKNKRKN